MENYFRIALWMFLLIGYLQGGPLNTCDWSSISEETAFKELRGETCSASLSFTSPSTNNNFQTVSDKEAALLYYKQGFEEARTNCNTTSFIDETLLAFDTFCKKTSTAYKGETSSTNYQGFVNNFERFLQLLKN